MTLVGRGDAIIDMKYVVQMGMHAACSNAALMPGRKEIIRVRAFRAQKYHLCRNCKIAEHESVTRPASEQILLLFIHKYSSLVILDSH